MGWQDTGAVHVCIQFLVKVTKLREKIIQNFVTVELGCATHVTILGNAQVVDQVTGIDLTKPAAERSRFKKRLSALSPLLSSS